MNAIEGIAPVASEPGLGEPPRAGAGFRAPYVVKLGGSALEHPEALRELAADLTALRRVVVVHGGGAEVTDWCERLAIVPRFEGGRRVTDPATLEVATAVLAGLANKRLVAALRAAGLDAVGIAALDGGIAEIAPHAEADVLGAVGEIRAIHASLLSTLIERGHVPVVASIGSREGRLLNLNADDLAGALAAGLRARALLMLSDVEGVSLGGAVVKHLDPAGLAAALANPEVMGGMRPKLAAARAALQGGVPRVAIAAWAGPGTLFALINGRGRGTLLGESRATPPFASTPTEHGSNRHD